MPISIKMVRVCILKTLFSVISRGLQNVSVIGAGQMGSGIAQVCIQNDFQVTLVDKNNSILSNATNTMRQSMLRIAGKQKMNEQSTNKFVDTFMTNLSISTDIEKGIQDSDLIIETIVEDMLKKQNLFRLIDEVCCQSSVKVSNTSSLSLREIGSVLEDPSRFAGLHFFQPVQVLELAEVIRTTFTSDATFQELVHFAKALKKIPIVCRDTPGFVVNRLLIPYLMDAIRMVERGDATKYDVDIGMKLGAGYPMGPLELCDFIGLDTIQNVCHSFNQQVPDDRVFLCPKILHDLVRLGKFGRKTGEGFFKYDKKGNVIKDT